MVGYPHKVEGWVNVQAVGHQDPMHPLDQYAPMHGEKRRGSMQAVFLCTFSLRWEGCDLTKQPAPETWATAPQAVTARNNICVVRKRL